MHRLHTTALPQYGRSSMISD
ncbi:MAG: hypothetical protein METHAR1v1_520020 [Methanothrix sp.]|nr:MAG: hypothetical protein METHAR1v1_520020 [Methanothrix sp.]